MLSTRAFELWFWRIMAMTYRRRRRGGRGGGQDPQFWTGSFGLLGATHRLLLVLVDVAVGIDELNQLVKVCVTATNRKMWRVGEPGPVADRFSSSTTSTNARRERREGQGLRQVGHSFLPWRREVSMHSLQKRCMHCAA